MRFVNTTRRGSYRAGLVLTLATSLLLSTPAASLAVTTQHIAIPSYFDVSLPGGPDLFQRIAQNRPTLNIAVINGPYSHAPVPFDQRTADAIKVMHDNGVTVLGYVDTGYFGFSINGFPAHQTRGGSTSSSDWTTQIEGDVNDWHTLYGSYGIDGIFFDEAIRTCGTNDAYVDLYAAVSDYVSVHYPSDYIVINPGAPSEQCYENVADTILTFEGVYANYTASDSDPDSLDFTPTSWTPTSPNKLWHLVYGATSQANMENAVALSKMRGAGFVYVTSDALPNPWDTVPGPEAYWNSELVKASGITDTTKPSPPATPQAVSVITSTTGAARAFLKWGSATDNVAVVKYDVYRGTTLIQSVYGATAQVTGLAASTSYTFKLKARDPSGNISNYSGSLNITTPAAAATPIINTSSCLDPNIAKYGATFADPFDFNRVLIDSDNTAGTGYPISTIGADYLIENGLFYQYVGPGWNWSQVTSVSPLVSSTNGVYAWQIPASALGTGRATTEKLVFNGGNLSGNPPDYTTAPLTVTQTSSC
jgi:hypothetical protein